MSKRMRLVGWQVFPVVMIDDGDNLEPVQLQGQLVPAAQWQEFKDGGDKTSLESVRMQIEGADSA